MDLITRSCLEIAFFSTLEKVDIEELEEKTFVQIFESFNRLFLAIDRLEVYQNLPKKEILIEKTKKIIKREIEKIWNLTNKALNVILELDMSLAENNLLVQILLKIQEVVNIQEQKIKVVS